MPKIALRPVDYLLLCLAIVNVIGYVLIAITINAIGFPLDDAWIHQTYARNLADHGEWAYIQGHPSNASTSPLYTVLLSIGHRLDISPYTWAHLLGIVALWSAGMISVRLAERLFPQTPHVGAGTGLLMVCSWHLIWAAAAGMETMLFMMFSLLLILWLWHELDPPATDTQQVMLQRGLILGIIGGLLYLTRPEGIGLLGLAGIIVWLSQIYPHWQRYVTWGLMVAIGFTVTISPYLIINWNIAGEILPATASAKIAQHAPLREDFIGLRYLILIVPIIAGAQVLWLPAIIDAIRRLPRRIQTRQEWLLWLPLIWAFAHLTLFAWRLPAAYQHGRYVMPVLPPVLLFAIGGMINLLAAGKHTTLGRVFSRVLAMSAVAGVIGFWLIGGQAYGNDVKIINIEMVKTARWLRDNPDIVPPEELLAVHDIGAVGYYAPRDILDLAGLVSPEVVPIIRDKDALIQRLCEKDARWLMVFPDQNPFRHPEDDPRLQQVFSTNEEFTIEAGGEGNMTIYRLRFGDNCGYPSPAVWGG